MSAAHVPEQAKAAAPIVSGPALELISDLARVPSSYIAHAATNNHNAPLIRHGEIVVVDTGGGSVTGGWIPVEGGLFLIEYTSPPTASERYARRSREIVQTFLGHRDRWYAGPLRRGVQGREFICVDGPYRDEMALADKLIGKVVGLYSSRAQIGGDA